MATLYSNDIGGQWTATVKRISNKIDENTQSVKVYLSVSGNNVLKEGMYLSGKMKAETIFGAVEIPSNLVTNGEIFIISPDSVLTATKVVIVKNTDKTVIVKGIQNNTTILFKNLPGAYDGMKISPIEE